MGGNGGGRPRLSKELAKDLTTDEAFELVDKIIEYYRANAKPRQRLGAMLDKMDFEEFRRAVITD